MAALKCMLHGPQADGLRFCPTCMESLVPDEPDEPDTQTADTAPTCCPEAGCGMPMTSAGCPVHSLGEAVAEAYREPAQRPTTRDHDEPAATVVDFPWGPVAVGAAQVWIGRSPDCGELAGRLESYDNVSRRHAVLWREGDALYLRDQDSTNGTFVNDRPVRPREKTRVHEGDVLRFGARLRAIVRRTREPA